MPDFFGHEKQWQLLKSSAALGKLSHAYLFSGKAGLGKKDMAKEFCFLLNCQDKSLIKKPCKKCQSCLEMDKNCHPDFLWLAVQEQGGKSEIDLIRNLGNWLCLKPGLGQYRLVVIDQIQNFSLAAQSALLKILEDPKGNAVLILIADYPEFLLDTIVSRAQEVKFNCLPDEKIISLLVAKGLDPEIAKKTAFLALGRTSRAWLLLDPVQMKLELARIAAFKKMLKGNLAFCFKEIEFMAEDQDSFWLKLEIWLSVLRMIFLQRIGTVEKVIIDDLGISLDALKNLIAALEKTNYLVLRTNTSKKLALENCFLAIH